MTVETIDYFSFHHPMRHLASQVSLLVRQKIFLTFMKVLKPTVSSRVLDVGATPDQTLPDSNFLESLYPYTENLVVTSIEDASHLSRENPGIRFVRTEKLNLPFKNNGFDIVFCSAVLEHVGAYRHQKRFVTELFRVSKRFFFVTPNRLFPCEVHTLIPFLHWLPASLHRSILKALRMEFWSRVENLNLLTPHSLRKLIDNSPHAHIRSHFLFGFPSNLIAYGESPESPL